VPNFTSIASKISGESRDLKPLLWLFDLDNTLHNASHAIMPAIELNMNIYMTRMLGDAVTVADPHGVAHSVDVLRDLYLRRYGATLLGLMKHHAVHPDEFLREAHRFDNLTAMIRFERGLARLLKRLPGRKILLTNAPHRYSRDVMRHLGVGRFFDRHISIESMFVHRRLQPKPSKLMLRKLLAREGVAANRCILVEDSLSNLKSAKALHLRTAWITQYLHASAGVNRPGYVDVKLGSVLQLPTQLHRLR
jgi:putative hydrolase of the HAD superfamily